MKTTNTPRPQKSARGVFLFIIFIPVTLFMLTGEYKFASFLDVD